MGVEISREEAVKREFIARAIERARAGDYPIVEPKPEDHERDLQWWLRTLDAKAFLFSTNGSAAWLFPTYELRLRPLAKRVVVAFRGATLVDSRNGYELSETAHPSRVYVPLPEVDFRYLFATETLTSCPFKGLARYYGVRAKAGEVTDAFWTYEDLYDRFPANGNASDILKLKGMLSPDPKRLEVTLIDESS